METQLWLIKKDARMINSGCTGFVIETWLSFVDGDAALAHQERRDSQLFGGDAALAHQERRDFQLFGRDAALAHSDATLSF